MCLSIKKNLKEIKILLSYLFKFKEYITILSKKYLNN